MCFCFFLVPMFHISNFLFLPCSNVPYIEYFTVSSLFQCSMLNVFLFLNCSNVPCIEYFSVSSLFQCSMLNVFLFLHCSKVPCIEYFSVSSLSNYVSCIKYFFLIFREICSFLLCMWTRVSNASRFSCAQLRAL